MINNGWTLVVLLLVGIMLPLFMLGGCFPEGDVVIQEETIGKPETQVFEKIQITKNITPQKAFNLIQKNKDNPDFVILDVRTPGEFSAERIEGAIKLDYYSDTFKTDLDKLDKSKIYLIYCRTGRRSGNALDIMKGLNFTEVYNILGGIIRWKAKGLPTIP